MGKRKERQVRFVNPKTDLAFKKVFASDDSEPSLIYLINALLNLNSSNLIVQASILDFHKAPMIKGVKDTYICIKAEDQQGQCSIIYIQILNVEGVEQENLYNACQDGFLEVNYNEGYSKKEPIIVITMTNFLMFEGDFLQHTFYLCDNEEDKLHNNKVALHFIEIPKFKKTINELCTVFDKWIYFFRYASSIQTIPEVLQIDSIIMRAFKEINSLGFTLEELDAQDKREFFIQDQRLFRQQVNELTAYRELKERKKQLENKVIQLKSTLQQAIKSLLPFLDDATIAAKTGVSEAEVRALRQTSQSS